MYVFAFTQSGLLSHTAASQALFAPQAMPVSTVQRICADIGQRFCGAFPDKLDGSVTSVGRVTRTLEPISSWSCWFDAHPRLVSFHVQHKFARFYVHLRGALDVAASSSVKRLWDCDMVRTSYEVLLHATLNSPAGCCIPFRH